MKLETVMSSDRRELGTSYFMKTSKTFTILKSAFSSNKRYKSLIGDGETVGRCGVFGCLFCPFPTIKIRKKKNCDKKFKIKVNRFENNI